MKPVLTRIDRSILALALPSIVSNITTPLLGLMDVAFTGHMGSATYLAAIAVGGTIFNLIYWIFGFLRMGTSGLTAQAYGRSADSGNRNECDASLLRGLIPALGIGLILILLHRPIARAALSLMDVDGATAELTYRYFMILSFGAPAVLSTYVFTGWLIGMQDARSAMYMSLIINVVNLAVSMLLVVGFGMKIEGVAFGTLSAQTAGFLTGGAIVVFRHKVRLQNIKLIFDTGRLKEFFSINTDIFLRTLCLVAVTTWFTRAGASQSTVVLAVNSVLMQFFMFFSYFMDGFAFSGEALVGRCIGARDHEGLKSTIRHLLAWGACVGLVFSVLYFIFGTLAVEQLTSEKDVIASSREYIGWVAVIPLAGFASFTYDGIYIGATMTRRMLLSMFSAMVVYFAIYFLTFKHLSNHGLWLAFIVYLLIRGIVLHASRRRLQLKINSQ